MSSLNFRKKTKTDAKTKKTWKFNSKSPWKIHRNPKRKGSSSSRIIFRGENSLLNKGGAPPLLYPRSHGDRDIINDLSNWWHGHIPSTSHAIGPSCTLKEQWKTLWSAMQDVNSCTENKLPNRICTVYEWQIASLLPLQHLERLAYLSLVWIEK